MPAVAALVTLIPLVITSIEEIEALREHLADHQRTLEQAEADRKAARADLDGTTPTP